VRLVENLIKSDGLRYLDLAETSEVREQNSQRPAR
jgi:hypothetical protein